MNARQDETRIHHRVFTQWCTPDLPDAFEKVGVVPRLARDAAVKLHAAAVTTLSAVAYHVRCGG